LVTFLAFNCFKICLNDAFLRCSLSRCWAASFSQFLLHLIHAPAEADALVSLWNRWRQFTSSCRLRKPCMRVQRFPSSSPYFNTCGAKKALCILIDPRLIAALIVEMEIRNMCMHI
jgi:hypothetical protein